MANRGGDPKVKAWMKEHTEEVERVERLYNVLRDKGFTELLKLAYDVGVDVEKHEEQSRNRLIADIVKTDAEKASAIISGQGVLLSGKDSSSNKRG